MLDLKQHRNAYALDKETLKRFLAQTKLSKESRSKCEELLRDYSSVIRRIDVLTKKYKKIPEDKRSDVELFMITVFGKTQITKDLLNEELKK